MTMRLRTLHALLFAAVALAVGVCGAWAALTLTGARLRAQIGTETAALAGQVSNLLDRSMYARWRDVIILSAAARTSAQSPDARRVWLNTMRETFPAYAWIGFADRDGRVTAATDHLLEGESVAERPWFKGGLNGPFAGDLHAALLLERYLPPAPNNEPLRFVDVAAPVFDANGKPDGVVGAHLSWSWARQLTASVTDPAVISNPGTEVLIVDQAGIVVLGPETLRGQRLDGASEIWRTAQSGAQYAVERWSDGTSYLVGASRTSGLNDYPGLGWTVLVRRPANLAFAPARRLARELMAGGCGLALLAALFGVLIGRRISAPLTRLTLAAQAMGRSPGTKPTLPRTGPTEVKELAATLEGMWQAVAERDAQLEQANRELEQRVAARTSELEDARATAERATHAKGEFLAAMSHEIRTPLNGVLGYTDLLLEQPELGSAARQYGERVQSAGSALLTVVNDILDFSKAEAGEIKLHPEAFALAGMIDNTASIVRSSAQSKGVTLTIAADVAVPTYLIGDQNRLRQVLLNLLNNAIKFTAHGSVSLSIDVVKLKAETLRLRFAVRDTGIGIPAAKQHLLFKSFSQVDGSIQREFGGTGLGLAISKRLVTLMDGEIGIESEEGRGSTFWFEVPLNIAESQALPEQVLPAVSERSGCRLLLVEDVPLNQELACTILKQGRHEVDVVASGPEAIRAVQDKTYDLVLMDVQMPGMDGLTATRHIRALKHPTASVPIIALTANVLPQQVESFRAAGMNDHVGKPFKREALFAAIERCARKPAEAKSHSGALDRAAFAEVTDSLGPEATRRLLGKLSEELESRFGHAGASLSPEELAVAAHAMVGMSGLMGFLAFSRLCSELEETCASGGDYRSLLDRIHSMKAEVLTEIENLRAA